MKRTSLAVAVFILHSAFFILHLQAQPAVCLERPFVWLTFDNPTNLYAHAGQVYDAFNDKNSTYVPNANGWGGAIKGGTTYSTAALAASATDLTVIHRMKVETAAKKFIFCFGSNNPTVMLGYCTDTNGKVRLQEISAINVPINYSANGVTFEPPAGIDLSADFHEYAFTYVKSTKAISCYLDGVLKGSFTASQEIRDGRKFQFFAPAGGFGSLGVTGSANTLVDDYRVYQRVLTTQELAELRTGRTVPVWGTYLDRYEQLIWPNTNLRDIYRFRARRGGTSENGETALAVFTEISPTTGYVQFEHYPENEKTYEKAIRVEYRQDGNDVWAKVLSSSYIQWQPNPQNGTANIGHDFRPLLGKFPQLQQVAYNENQALATGSEQNGYGVRMLTADKLTDDDASVRDGDAWADNVAPAAGRPVSFRSGSGTWSNPTAGAAYGTLAFGVESGAWDLAGESATFADVVNASAHRQKISFAYTAGEDEVFAPEVGAAGMTFKDLTVPGTFYPKGPGGVVHEGETRIGTYNARLGLSVIERPAIYPSKRNAWSNMVNVARIVTAPGSHTEIDSILPNMATFNDSILHIEGDTTIGTIDFPNDTYLVLTNGTITFRNGVDVTGLTQRWVNGFIMVHEDAVLNIPSFMTWGTMKFYIDGRVDSNRFATPVSRSSDMMMQGSGELNLSGEGIVGTRQETIYFGLRELGADASLLPIKADLDFKTDPLRYTGTIGIRTVTKSGIPATVMQNGAFKPNNEAIAIYGGGTFKTDSTVAANFGGSLTVGDNTTVDLASAASFSAVDLTLGADSELRVPYTAGQPLVTGTLTLPESGSVLLRLNPDGNFGAGDFTLTGDGVAVDASAAEKIRISISGTAGSVYTASLVYDNGALKLHVVKEDVALKATISFPGYTGTTTLENFPVQIRLPDCVSGFSYGDMLDPTSGDEIYFTDEAGNALAHDIEIWRKDSANADADASLIWVKVPQFNKDARIVMHWGKAKPAEKTVASTATWSAYVGVWHMNHADGASTTLEPDAAGYCGYGTPRGNHLSELTAYLSSDKGRGYVVRNMTTANQNSNRLEMPNNYASRVVTFQNITVSGWFYRTSVAGYSRAFRSKNGSNVNGFEVEMDDGKTNVIKVRGSNSASYNPTIDSFYNTWCYLTIVYEGTTAYVYSNGALKGSGGITTAVSNGGGGFAVGGCLNASSKSLTGFMDEFRIANGSLSADWIKASYDTVQSVDTFSAGYGEVEGAFYDFRDKVGTYVVDFDTAGKTVYVGEDTVLTIPASGTLIIEPGMKATVREWFGPVDNRGWLKLTGSGLVTESHITGTIEYAGIYTLNYQYVKAPTVSSGTTLIAGPLANWLYTSGGTFTVAGGRLTLLGQVSCGNAAALAGETKAAYLNVTGGVVEAPEGSFAIVDDATKDVEINLTGGTWAAPFKCGYSNTDAVQPKLNISGTAVFAPTSVGIGAYNGLYSRWVTTVKDGGRFVLPDDLNGLFKITGGAVEGSLYRDADFDLVVRLDLAEGTTLALDAGTEGAVYRAQPAAEFAGPGTLALKDGVTLDLTAYPVATNFTGTIEVRAGATLILPSDVEPTFGIDVKDGGKVKAVLTMLPEETPPFLGAIKSLPDSGAATLEIEIPGALPLGEYRLANGAIGAGNLANLNVVFTGAAGETTGGNLALDGDGQLKVVITQSDNPGFALEWAPADATMQVTTNTAVLAWKRYGSDDATRYPYYARVPLYFTDAAANKNVVFDGVLAPTKIVVDATADYAFGGEVDVGANSLAKLGTGRLTIGAPRFPALTNVVVEAGVVGFGADAREGVLGDETVPVQVKSGATLDLSDGITDNATKGPLWNKTAYVAGEGVDGQGAVRRHGVAELSHARTLRKLVLTDDTLLKGDSLSYFDRMDISRGETTGGIFDPETNKTLTVSGVFNVHGPIEVGAINVVNGWLIPEADTARIAAPGGVTIGDHGELRSFAYNANTIPVNAPVRVVGEDTAIGNSNLTLNQGLTVAADADVTVNRTGSGTTAVTGGIANDGEIAVKAGAFRMNGGTYSGAGVFAQSAGTSVFSGEGSAISANFAVTGGVLRFGEGENLDMPTIGTLTGSIRSTSTFIEPAYVRTIGDEFDEVFTATGESVGDIQLRAGRNELKIDGATWDLGNGRLSVGNAKGEKGVTFENSTVTAYRLCLGETPYGYLTWKSGTLNLTGGSTADGLIFGYTAATAQDERFTMEGGLLTCDKGAIRSYRPRRDGLFMNLEAGTWRPKASRWFESYTFPFAFGDGWRRTGREYTLDLPNELFLNFSRISMGGSSDVKVTGSGHVTSLRGDFSTPYQGVSHGKWTIETTGGHENFLTGVASFESGIELADGALACVSIEGDGIVEATMMEGNGNFAAATATNNTPTVAMSDATANSWMMHLYRAAGDNVFRSNCSYLTRGQFYVPEAGTWYFAGTFDDYLAFYIDGTPVFQTTAANDVKTGSRALTAGWHSFTITGYDGGGGQGPAVGAWKTRNLSLGWTTVETDSTDANDYQPFDNTTVRMRSEPSIRWQRSPVAGNASLQNPPELRAYTEWTTDSVTNTLRMINTKQHPALALTINRFSGYFYVDNDHVGEWSFRTRFDDTDLLVVDGEEVFCNNHGGGAADWSVGTITLAQGFHSFEFRCVDGGGGWGGKAQGNVPSDNCTCLALRPGDDDFLPFDENLVNFAADTMKARHIGEGGILGELSLGEGATLRNWVQRGACPILGTLCGEGTLSGPFRFAGSNNCWRVSGTSSNLNPVQFTNADASALAGLKTVELDFANQPLRNKYELADALGLTAETVEDVALTVKVNGTTKNPRSFRLAIENGKLIAKNSACGVVLFIR